MDNSDVNKILVSLGKNECKDIAIILAGGTSKNVIPEEIAKTFLEQGGTIVTLDTSGELANYPTTAYTPLLSGNQGGGGDRGGLYQRPEFQANVSKHTPAWQRIRETKHILFISSMTGATGSTSVPTFLRAVMSTQSKYQLFFLGAWSREAVLAIRNTKNTLDSIAGVRMLNEQIPIGMFVWETENDFTVVNDKMLWTALMLIKMLSLPAFDLSDIATKMKLPGTEKASLMALTLEANVKTDAPLEACEGRLVAIEEGTLAPSGLAGHAKTIRVPINALGGYSNMVLSTRVFPLKSFAEGVDATMARTKAALIQQPDEVYTSPNVKVGELSFV
jgi:hypothetical protein